MAPRTFREAKKLMLSGPAERQQSHEPDARATHEESLAREIWPSTPMQPENIRDPDIEGDTMMVDATASDISDISQENIAETAEELQENILEIAEAHNIEDLDTEDVHWLLQAAQYGDVDITYVDELEPRETTPITHEHEDFGHSDALDPAEESVPAGESDPAEALPHDRDDNPMSNFNMAMALWAEQSGISRADYQSLVEILQSLEDVSPIYELPLGLSTLKKKCKAQFPIMPIRHTKIPIVSPLQLPTLPAAEKTLVSSIEKDIFFQDTIQLITNLIKSPEFRQHMHVGMAELVDTPSELWHSRSWGASVKYSSGETARSQSGSIVLPSDIVYYRCEKQSCACHYLPDNPRQIYHLGRVLSVAKDFRSQSPNLLGTVVCEVQAALRYSRHNYHGQLPVMEPEFETKEIILVVNKISYIPIGDIMSRADVYVDRKYGLEATDTEPYNGVEYFLRRVIDTSQTPFSIMPYHQTVSPRGELDIATYGREALLDIFCSNRRVVSLPYQLFIDGFGLYRNMYRSLMGIYLIPGVEFSHRNKRSSIYTLTFGPHSTNFTDAIGVLAPGLSKLDSRGVSVDIAGESILVVASCIAFLGDMPQQNDNAGIKRPSANKSCRSCLVDERNRSSLTFDIKGQARSHYFSQSKRMLIDNATTPADKRRICQEYGMALHDSPLFAICPSLNLVSYFPSDPCHSEFNGISKTAHQLLVSSILSPEGQKQYLRALQVFPFPRGWARLQSPITHLESYQLQEHARASLLIPIVLRCYLQSDWIQPSVYRALPMAFVDDIDCQPISLVVKVFAAIARSNSVLTSQSPITHDPEEAEKIIIGARRLLQNLINAVVTAAPTYSRATSVIPSQPGTPGPSNILRAPSEGPTVIETVSRRAKGIEAIKNRPNMHIGLHYPEQIREYGIANNCSVLVGEDKHRDYKNLVYRTNHRDVEKVLLMQESFKRTLQLILQGAFSDNEPAITAQIQDLFRSCPTVFNHLLRIDIAHINTEIPNMRQHEAINVWAEEKASLMAAKLQLPSAKISKLPNMHPFLEMLRSAYETDWEKPSVLEPGPRPIKFFQKVSFVFDKQGRRSTIAQGDIIKYRDTNVGQVIAIFTHTLGDTKRAFLCAIPMQDIQQDAILQLPILRVASASEYVIVGVPAVQSTIFAVPVNVARDNAIQLNRQGTFFINCTWGVAFL